jgi:hypothetical protein
MRAERLWLLVLAAFCLTYGGYNLGRSLFGPKCGLDFAAYYVTAKMTVTGQAEHMYDEREEFDARAKSWGVPAVASCGEKVMTTAYPPSAAFLLVPFALLPFSIAKYVFFAVSVVSVVLAVSLFMSNRPAVRRKFAMLAGLLACFCFFPTYYVLYMGQVGGLLLLCCVLVLFFARKNMEWPAGLFLALAVMIKLFPIVLFAFFLLKRRYRLVAAAVVFMVLIFVASLTTCDFGLYTTYFGKVLPEKVSGGAFYRNQGFEGFSLRLLTFNEHTKAVTNSPMAAVVLARSLAVLALLIVLVLTRKRTPAGTLRYEIEFGMYFVAAMLAVPKAWEHMALFLLLAYFPLIDYLVRKRNGRSILLFLVMVSLCVWALLLTTGGDYGALPRSLLGNLSMSVKFFATLLLFGCCAVTLMGREKPALLERVEGAAQP